MNDHDDDLGGVPFDLPPKEPSATPTFPQEPVTEPDVPAPIRAPHTSSVTPPSPELDLKCPACNGEGARQTEGLRGEVRYEQVRDTGRQRWRWLRERGYRDEEIAPCGACKGVGWASRQRRTNPVHQLRDR